MFIERLLNQGNAPLIEQAVRFSAARQRLIAENVANISAPGYRQKDLSVSEFQKRLVKRVEERHAAPPGTTRFDDLIGDVEHPTQNILFHDGGNRSIEQLAADSQKNAMYHNMMIELLRKQIGAIQSALQERVA
jgi:flagellar basal-body rod protein FlgB